MVNDWLSLDEIFIVQPKTTEEVDLLADDLMPLVRLIPGQTEDYFDCIRDYPHYITLVYHHDEPVAYIKIGDAEGYDWLGKESLDFAGSVHPDYLHKGLTQQVAPKVIRQAFLKTGKKKMLARVAPDNEAARHAINALGFKIIGKTPSKNLLYKLDRTDALA